MAHDLASLLQSLDALPEGAFEADLVSEWMGELELDHAALAPYASWGDERYTRNLVRRSPRFDLILLCWPPGARTPIHNHNGQRGWVRVLRGTLRETSYATTPGAPHAIGETGDACRSLQGPLRETDRADFPASEAVVTVDTERAIHALANPTTERAVSLHVYSLPHDSCLTYDLETGKATRVELRFDTEPVPARR